MDWHPNKGRVETLLEASCYGNRDKLRVHRPIGSSTDLSSGELVKRTM